MEYLRLGRTGLRVSPIVLGTVNFGWLTDEASSFAILDEATLNRLDELFPGPGGPAPEAYAW